MAKIKNMEQLRDHALDTLEKLSNGSIDTAQAGVTGKLCEGVIATVKSQLEYARMINEEPHIPFMHDSHQAKTIEGKAESKSLPSPDKKYLYDR
jgi:hypothetical protein